MTAPVPGQIATTSGSAGGAVTVALPAVSTSGSGVLLVVRSYAGSSTDPTPPTPSGWTLIGSASSASSTFRVVEAIFARDGDGTTCAVTFAAATNVTRYTTGLEVAGGIVPGAWWGAPVTAFGASSVTSRTLTIGPTPSSSLLLASVGTSGTFGGTVAWSGATALLAGGQFGSHAIARAAGSESGATITGTWATSTLAAAVAIRIGGGVSGVTSAQAPGVAVSPASCVATATSTVSVAHAVVDAHAPEITTSPALASVTATTAAPAWSGQVAARAPSVLVSPAASSMSAATAIPSVAGDLSSTAPLVTVSIAADLTATTAVPSATGSIDATAPPVTVGAAHAALTAASISAPPPVAPIVRTLTVGAPVRTLTATTPTRTLAADAPVRTLTTVEAP